MLLVAVAAITSEESAGVERSSAVVVVIRFPSEYVMRDPTHPLLAGSPKHPLKPRKYNAIEYGREIGLDTDGNSP